MVDDGENNPSPGWDSAHSGATEDVSGMTGILSSTE